MGDQYWCGETKAEDTSTTRRTPAAFAASETTRTPCIAAATQTGPRPRTSKEHAAPHLVVHGVG